MPTLVAATFLVALPARAEEPRDLNAPIRVGLIAGGAGVLLLSYGYPCAKGGGRWCVPIVGPVLQIAHLEREERKSNAPDGVVPPIFVYTLLVEEGLVQLFGASCVLAGAFVPRREEKKPARSVRVLPMLGPAVLGIGAAGSF